MPTPIQGRSPLTSTLLDHRYSASILAILSDFCFVAMDGTVQYLEVEYGIPVGQITFMRMGGTALFILVWLCYSNPYLISEVVYHPKAVLLWVRGTNNSLNLMLMYAALLYIPLSENLVVFHLRPFPTALLCFVFLNESFSKTQVLASLLSFGAVLLVIQPHFMVTRAEIDKQGPGETSHRDRLVGFTLTFLGTITSAVDILLVRRIGSEVNPLLILFVYMISGTLLVTGWMAVMPSDLVIKIPFEAWGLILGVILTGLFAQLTFVLALQMETGGYIAILGYLQVVFAILIQFLYVGTVPNFLSLGGMAIIVGVGIWSAMYGAARDDSKGQEEAGEMESGVPLLMLNDGSGRQTESHDRPLNI